ncbi:MAG: outer membrane lipoprotein carrier protein LolA [Bacteroidales bacterium]|jgi:outer membrane lipoprotein-sorting protein|nr:outer membrane lipoprotein carrier protein LolA [Bacteroidales bacterium]
MRKYILTLVSSVMYFAILPAQPSGFSKITGESSFKAKLSSKVSSVHSISCSFVQNQYITGLEGKVRSSGKFYYAEPEKIRMDYSSPLKYRMTIKGDKIKTVSDGKSSVVSLKGNPVMSQIKCLLSACISGNLGLLSSSYQVEYYESSDRYLVRVTPLSGTVGSYIRFIDIFMEKRDMSVCRLVMHGNGTDYTQYDFFEKKFNAAIDESFFSIH